MNENAKKWVAALRSGEFKQAKNSLHKVRPDGTVGYCCLGVACEVYNAEQKRKKKAQLPEDWKKRSSLVGAAEPVRYWLGLSDSWGAFGENGINSLADANDSGKRFPTIANLIEREPRGLFK